MHLMPLWASRNAKTQDQEWTSVAGENIEKWRHLSVEERDRIRDQAARFTSSRRWEGLDGLVVTPTMRAVVSVQACLLTVNIGMGNLNDVTSVLIVPGPSRTHTRHAIGGSMITESDATVIGQAALHGPVKLSWNQVAHDLEQDSTTSVVIHEFAHKVDMADGTVDGTPPIRGHDQSLEFEDKLAGVLETLRSGEDGGPLREYGATNRSELFAVATEAFFLSPRQLQARFEELYRALAGFYRQSP